MRHCHIIPFNCAKSYIYIFYFITTYFMCGKVEGLWCSMHHVRSSHCFMSWALFSVYFVFFNVLLLLSSFIFGEKFQAGLEGVRGTPLATSIKQERETYFPVQEIYMFSNQLCPFHPFRLALQSFFFIFIRHRLYGHFRSSAPLMIACNSFDHLN